MTSPSPADRNRLFQDWLRNSEINQVMRTVMDYITKDFLFH